MEKGKDLGKKVLEEKTTRRIKLSSLYVGVTNTKGQVINNFYLNDEKMDSFLFNCDEKGECPTKYPERRGPEKGVHAIFRDQNYQEYKMRFSTFLKLGKRKDLMVKTTSKYYLPKESSQTP